MTFAHAAGPGAPPTAEHARLAESPHATNPWRLWGPYLAGRQWGTVREDYSDNGDAWSYLPFEQAPARAYRWGEDGLGGYCDRYGFLNISVAMWNGRDDRLKERLFGLTNGEGNHGEDVKEYFWAVDGTPTHSWSQWLYRYPQRAFPYDELRAVNRARGKDEREYELADTGVLDDNRFFDILMTWAKAAPDDLVLVIDATNRGPEPAPLHLVPQIWFRNTWAWGRDPRRPSLRAVPPAARRAGGMVAVECTHDLLGRYVLAAEGAPEILCCDNETDAVALFGAATNASPYPKNGVERRVVGGDAAAVNPDGSGTKAGLWYRFDAVGPGQTVRVRLRLSPAPPDENTFGTGFDAVLSDRAADADAFYASVLPARLSAEDATIARRAFAGLLWNKQLYRYSVEEWLAGDPAQPPPPDSRRRPGRRNVGWDHLALADVMSMPDEWEYPWFAAWDLAFHCVTLAHIDPDFAKDQMLLLCREWAMHPNGELPAYEWAFGDVNPPVHAWAAWQVYVNDGRRDTDFLLRVFGKLLLYFGWWVNRKDADDSNLFEGGFLGMDNVGLFDRSAALPPGHRLEQSDATGWMAFFCLSMLTMAVELAPSIPAVDDLATTFLERFLAIAHAMRNFGSQGVSLWDDTDGFFYDVLVHDMGEAQEAEPLRVRSVVGLLPILPVALAPPGATPALPDFAARLRWLQQRRPDLLDGLTAANPDAPALLALVDAPRLSRLLSRMLDESEFLSPHGIRSLSAAYRVPFSTDVEGTTMTIDYEPGESRSNLFGGNSNWRGPVWLPVNVLLADALRTHGAFHGDAVRVDFPTGSGKSVTLAEVSDALDLRLVNLFRAGDDGRRPCDGDRIESSADRVWRDHLTFSEYFHGDTGEGLGASHQTGWTALVAHILCRPDP